MAPHVSVMPSSLTRPGGAFFLDPAQRVTRAELEMRDARWRAMRDRAHAAQRRAQATGRWMGTLSRTASSISRRSGSVWFDEEATLVGSVARYYAARVVSSNAGDHALLPTPRPTTAAPAVGPPTAFPSTQSNDAAIVGESATSSRWGLRGRARGRLLSSPATFSNATPDASLFPVSTSIAVVAGPSLAQSIVEESRARSPTSYPHTPSYDATAPSASYTRARATNDPSAALLEALQPLGGNGTAAAGRKLPRLKNVKKAWRRWKATLA